MPHCRIHRAPTVPPLPLSRRGPFDRARPFANENRSRRSGPAPAAVARNSQYASTSGWVHDAGNRFDELSPAGVLGGELLLAGRGEAIVFGSLVTFGQFPLGLEPALFLEAMQRGVERTRLHMKRLAGTGANRLG